jgi:hypothetical protein
MTSFGRRLLPRIVSDAKVRAIGLEGLGDYPHIENLGAGWAATAPGYHLPHASAGALENSFHGAIGPIPDPASKAQRLGTVTSGRAEIHALDQTGYYHPPPDLNHRRLAYHQRRDRGVRALPGLRYP